MYPQSLGFHTQFIVNYLCCTVKLYAVVKFILPYQTTVKRPTLPTYCRQCASTVGVSRLCETSKLLFWWVTLRYMKHLKQYHGK